MNPMLPLGIVADDLTGALDAAAPFAARGYRTDVVLRSSGPSTADVVARSAESRMLTPDAAVARTVALAHGVTTATLFKKIDSLLRGPLAAEIAALAAAISPDLVIVAPAFPAQGRVTIGGVQYAHGRPVHESVRDPFAPAATSDLALLLADAGLATRLLALGDIGAGPDAVRAALAAEREGGRVVVADAERQEDLDTLVRATATVGSEILWCGAAGLAHALAAALPPAQARPPPPAVRRALVVCGSMHPASLAQCVHLERQAGVVGRALLAHEGNPASLVAPVRHLLQENPCVLLTLVAPPEGDRPDRARALAALETLAAGLRNVPSLGVVATGGETAAALCRGFGFTRLAVCDVLDEGIPRSIGHGGPCDGMPVITKAGGFGAATALWDAARSMLEAR
jgi:uncharacterized protein YgbK (DUF1537 family)